MRLAFVFLSSGLGEFELDYFASTAQPGTQSDDIWARWPAKPPSHLLSFFWICLQKSITVKEN